MWQENQGTGSGGNDGLAGEAHVDVVRFAYQLSCCLEPGEAKAVQDEQVCGRHDAIIARSATTRAALKLSGRRIDSDTGMTDAFGEQLR